VPVAFDGAASHDPDGTIVAHRWDFDRSDGVVEEAKGAKTSHVYSKPGSYVATVVVTDNHGLEDADTVAVSIGPAPPPSDARSDAVERDAAGDRSPADADTADGSRHRDRGGDSRQVAPPASGCGCTPSGEPPRGARPLLTLLLALVGLCSRIRRR